MVSRRPDPDGPDWYALFAVLPVLAFEVVLLVGTALVDGIWWDASFAAGTVLLSGAFALFLSYLAFNERASAV